MIISFAWTTPALLAGAKTMTRREWTTQHALKFHAGDLVDAWNRSPRAGRSSGARKVATIRLTRDPYEQSTRELDSRDYAREGFAWLERNGEFDRAWSIWTDWTMHYRTLWVVEFELVDAWDEYHKTTDAQLREVVAADAPGLGSEVAAAASSAIGGDLR